MKTSFTVVLALALLTSVSLVAQPMPHGPKMPPGYFSTEFKAIQAQLGDKTLGELKVSELIPLAERLDVASQKDRAVRMTALMSYMMPGAGLIHTGDWGLGALQAGLSLAIVGGSLYWANTLLPADIQLGKLDYSTASHATIMNLWKAHTFNDLAPALGAAALGSAVDLVVRVWSAQSGREAVKAAIDSGKITFEPHLGSRGLGMGLSMRY